MPDIQPGQPPARYNDKFETVLLPSQQAQPGDFHVPSDGKDSSSNSSSDEDATEMEVAQQRQHQRDVAKQAARDAAKAKDEAARKKNLKDTMQIYHDGKKKKIDQDRQKMLRKEARLNKGVAPDKGAVSGKSRIRGFYPPLVCSHRTNVNSRQTSSV